MNSWYTFKMLLRSIFFLLIFKGAVCLQFVSLEVPESIFVGQVARLSCLFDEGHDVLYSVKWYKDDVEFFRFLPHDRPANQFFKIGDIDVDMTRSSNGTVFLRDTTKSAAGSYRCEVSADAPSFQSITKEKYMAVENKPLDPKNGAQIFRSTTLLTVAAIIIITITTFSHW